jgi:hypothetical protein
MPSRPSGVPAWDWYLHEVWWVLARWPEKKRVTGRSAIANYYVNRHLRHAVQAAGVGIDEQPAAWQRLVRALDEAKQDRSEGCA